MALQLVHGLLHIHYTTRAFVIFSYDEEDPHFGLFHRKHALPVQLILWVVLKVAEAHSARDMGLDARHHGGDESRNQIPYT
jgi:hypothetical protein